MESNNPIMGVGYCPVCLASPRSKCKCYNRAKEKLEGVKTNTSSSKNWTEDYSDEKGSYMNTCKECRHTFLGHKYRRVCKECHSKASAGDIINPVDIFVWLENQKCQTDHDESGEYRMYYELDLPRILEDYYAYRMRLSTNAVIEAAEEAVRAYWTSSEERLHRALLALEAELKNYKTIKP